MRNSHGKPRRAPRPRARPRPVLRAGVRALLARFLRAKGRRITPEQWERVKEVFHGALDLPAAERDAFVARACAGDAPLRAHVNRLLEQHDLDAAGPTAPGAPALPNGRAPALLLRASDRIGSYRVLRVLGEGGMGVVYLAEQDRPKRTVALKVIRHGVASPSMLRRFEHEAQVLGRLQHPGIANIFEAGTADTGHGPQPWFAMELVRGPTLLDYCREKSLGTRARLELVTRVCDGVQHAHSKGVIHRDLKPGNILVDELGQPKILDFGVARATDADIHTTTLRTDIGQLLGTVPYMSPEQAAGNAEDLDTRSDVYSLGVVTYELLAGRLPYDLERRLVLEAVRVIREAEPVRLSALDKAFRGDIDTIVGKALLKERARRYQSAADLADDIRRHLRNEPILARPPTAAYQISRFAKFHRAHEAAEAIAVTKFLQELLASAEPLGTSGKETTIRQILDQTVARLDATTLKDQAPLESEVRAAVAMTYQGLGLFAKAESHARRSAELREKLFNGPHPDLAASLLILAQALTLLGRADEAERVARRCLDMRRAMAAPATESPEIAESLVALADALAASGRSPAAEESYRDAVEMYQRATPHGHAGSSYALAGLATCLLARGNAEEAEPLIREAFRLQHASLPEGHWHLISTRSLLGACLAARGYHEGAEPLLVDSFTDLKDNPSVPLARKQQALRHVIRLYEEWDRPDKAEEWRARLAALAPNPDQ